MRILIEVTHPAHVHFFRNAIEEFGKRGHTVAVTARQKDITVQLLENYNIPYTLLSKMGVGRFGLIKELIIRDFRLWNFCRQFKPDILTGISAVFAAHVGFVRRRPVVIWDDTEHAGAHKLADPFARVICTPDCYKKSLGKKQRRYAGCHELAYLHPKRFKPDIEIVRSFGVNPEEKYCIVRFVSWQAHHDVGQRGIADEEKFEFIKGLSSYAKPYITSEAALPRELEQYRLPVPAHLIHHIMAFSSLYVGEGATMASESAVLGVPSVYINTLKLGYIDMLEEYGLVKQTTDTKEAFEKSVSWLVDPEANEKCLAAREKLLSEKIDVTEYIVETLESSFEAGQRS